MLRSEPGALDRLAADEHRAFGRRMMRPQAGNQPQHGRLAAARRPEDRDELALVRQVLHRERDVADDGEVAEPLRDVSNSTMLAVGSCGRGLAHRHSSTHAVRKQTALEPEQHAVDAVREQPDDDQDQDDVLRQPAPLAGHQQVAEAVLRVDQLGEHDVAERQAEQVPQAVVDVGQRQRDEHLRARSGATSRRASAPSRRSDPARSTIAATASE